MKRMLIPIILLIMLAIEGVAMELLPPSIKFASVYMTPHWILIFLIFVVTYAYPNESFMPILFATIFGLMTDIVYTGILGVYMFMLAISVYIGQLLNRLLQTNIFMMMLIALVSLSAMELGLFGIYSLLGISAMPYNDFFIHRLAPTIIANLLFFIVIYYPVKKMLLWINDGEVM